MYIQTHPWQGLLLTLLLCVLRKPILFQIALFCIGVSHLGVALGTFQYPFNKCDWILENPPYTHNSQTHFSSSNDRCTH